MDMRDRITRYTSALPGAGSPFTDEVMTLEREIHSGGHRIDPAPNSDGEQYGRESDRDFAHIPLGFHVHRLMHNGH
jgi:hypothetical protein